MNANFCTDTYQKLIYHNALETIYKLLAQEPLKVGRKICVVITGENITEIEEIGHKIFETPVNVHITSTTISYPPPPGHVLNDLERLQKHELKNDGRIVSSIHKLTIPNNIPDIEGEACILSKLEVHYESLFNLHDLLQGEDIYDAVILLSCIDWTLNPNFILQKVKSILKPCGIIYVLTSDGYPTSLVHATERILETPYWKNLLVEHESEPKSQIFALIDVKDICNLKAMYQDDLLPWKRSWMRHRNNSIFDENADPERGRAFMKILEKAGYFQPTAYFLEKISYYCYDSEDSIRAMVKNIFNAAPSVDANFVEKMRPKFAEAFAEYVMEDNRKINGHRLNSFQSFVLVKAHMNQI